MQLGWATKPIMTRRITCEKSGLAGPARAAALDSARMKWSVPDAAPTERLNRILWGAIKGWSTPYPGARQSVFSPLAIDIDDDDRERKH